MYLSWLKVVGIDSNTWHEWQELIVKCSSVVMLEQIEQFVGMFEHFYDPKIPRSANFKTNIYPSQVRGFFCIRLRTKRCLCAPACQKVCYRFSLTISLVGELAHDQRMQFCFTINSTVTSKSTPVICASHIFRRVVLGWGVILEGKGLRAGMTRKITNGKTEGEREITSRRVQFSVGLTNR